MKEIKLKIRQLGMIGESDEVTLNRLMVFSGESGLGKSYLSILCHYMFYVLLDNKRISSYFTDKGLLFNNLRKDYHGSGVAITFAKTDFESWMANDAITWLGYMVGNKNIKGDISITLPSSVPDIISMEFEEEMVGLANNVDTYIKLKLPGLTYNIKDSGGINDESPFAYLFRYYLIQEIFGVWKSLEDTYIFPPSRGPVLTETVLPQTGMYSEFQKCLTRLHASRPDKIEVSDQIKNLLNRVLNGSVKHLQGKYIYSTNGTEMPLSAAAASIRELASLEFLIENSNIDKSSIMIDEPEAHLHPLKQRLMADVITCLINGGAHVQVTTHSDYFLRRLNELVIKHKLYERSVQKGSPKEYYDICKELKVDPDLRLNSDDISAYLLQKNNDTNNVSRIVRQDMSNGIPFSSFHDAIDESLKMKMNLEKFLNQE